MLAKSTFDAKHGKAKCCFHTRKTIPNEHKARPRIVSVLLAGSAQTPQAIRYDLSANTTVVVPNALQKKQDFQTHIPKSTLMVVYFDALLLPQPPPPPTKLNTHADAHSSTGSHTHRSTRAYAHLCWGVCRRGCLIS